MRTKRLDFIYRPLQMNRSMEVEGSVPAVQSYDANEGAYEPDYTLTPLSVLPKVGVIDKDGIAASGNVNSKLTNISWYVIENGVRTLITDASEDFSFAPPGGSYGEIHVMRNAAPGGFFTLEFNAQYLDSRTGQVMPIVDTITVRCENASQPAPVLTLDVADQNIYNPLRDGDSVTITAALRVGVKEVAAANRTYVWELLRDNGAWTEVGDEENLDYFATVSADTTKCTINRHLMGESISLRCRARYDTGGNPAGVTLGAAAPQRVVTFRRRLPKYEYDIGGVPANIPDGTGEINPSVLIWDGNGNIPNPGRELLPMWSIATNNTSGGSLELPVVAMGYAPAIPTDKMSATAGAVLGLDMVDRGPVCAWEDSDGTLLTDGDGAILLIH